MINFISKIGKNFSASKPNLRLVISQIWLPSIIAIIYALYDWQSSGKAFKLTAFFKVVFPTLFFVMWFVSIYERAKKRNTDKDAFDGLNNGIQSLTTLVEELRFSSHSTSSQPVQGQFPTTRFSYKLMQEAEDVFNNGHHLAALLQAGVAFEQAIRSFAVRKGLADAVNIPLLKILQKIDFLLPKGWQTEIHMLRKIRNQMAHATENELSDIGNADMVLRTYRMAIEALENEPN